MRVVLNSNAFHGDARADRSGVAGTPTSFINGRRHDGAYDVATLSRAVKTAGAHSLVAT